MADPYPFKDKVITVTGASRGTGLALVRYLLVTGATVSGCATSEENLAKAMAGIEQDLPEHKERVWFKAVDISKPAMVKAWIEETVSKFGKLDGCANVAAREQRKIYPMTDLDADYFNDLININVSGLFNCLKEEMKHIKDGGSIVNCGSVTSQYASAGVAAYVAAKHAVIGLTKVAAFEGAPRKVRVNALCPGCIDTEMMAEPFDSPLGQFTLTADNVPILLKGRLAETREIAASIAFLLGDESRYVTKATWFVDGGWTEGSYSV
ncbi:NAD(P)-binding protein [Sodiomyces alkalinus F11]|uniref:NAD(P)-binding protein n=1 Tax=Sodiomyces alkalinus (strain CBS 110278 / VKM F-3762 / F11) TaxID=1314773 RepID=A0A3N2Q3F9_SODAK|nr:NAD(P)-binding protein [Sodiomyces alkalinus F11]ROT41303.1 NAD(P)-binding protein [Sodiomyces alkalinus F11]